MFSIIKNLVSYRSFILSNVKREFQLKYQSSILGSLWSIINPLAMIVVYTVIFSQLMKARIPGIEGTYAYSIYLCSGIIFWGMFAEVVEKLTNCFIDNANLIKKISFPKVCIPASIVVGAGINFLIMLALFILFLLITGNLPLLKLINIVPVFAVLVLFASGLGVFLAVLNVFFRDVGQFIRVLLQFWFWGTPIIYPISILPDALADILVLNPMVTIIHAAQAIFVPSLSIDYARLGLVGLGSFLLLWVAVIFFRKHSDEIVDEI
ncbi:ABC transporter permease [Vibrio fluvialis]|nr:ABC transporter permease [Vibrio fluvialis]MBL4280035.1 ABC transporter permease [Vibrio fluvialis]